MNDYDSFESNIEESSGEEEKPYSDEDKDNLDFVDDGD